jgi:ankyrin repeat protein
MNPRFAILATLAALPLSKLRADDAALQTAFRDALYAEEVTGDAAAALEAYTKLLVELDARRDLHATALFRQAECLRKLGKNAEAIAGYQKVLQLYPDVARYQKSATEALAALGAPADPPAAELQAAVDAAEAEKEYKQQVAEVEKILRESPDQLNSAESNLLAEAVRTGNLRMVQFLIEKGATPNVHGINKESQPLTLAAKLGHKAIAELLLAKGADVKIDGNAPLAAALLANNLQILKLLVEKGATTEGELSCPASEANPVPTRQTGITVSAPILSYAITSGSLEALELLLSTKPKLDRNFAFPNLGDAPSALICAVYSGDAKKVAMLLNAGASANFPTGSVLLTGTQPPLFSILESTPRRGTAEERQKIVQLLLDAGTDLKAKTSRGNTLFHVCPNLVLSHPSLVDAAIKAGVDVNARNAQGNTVLHIASPESIAPWIKLGADPNVANQDGKTPLEYRTDGIQQLLDGKADPSLKNPKGHTPLEAALRSNDVIHFEKAAILARNKAPTSYYPFAASFDEYVGAKQWRISGNRAERNPQVSNLTAALAEHLLDSKKEERPGGIWISLGLALGEMDSRLAFVKFKTKNATGAKPPEKDDTASPRMTPTPGLLWETITEFAQIDPLDDRDFTSVTVLRLQPDGTEQRFVVNLLEPFSDKENLVWGDIINLPETPKKSNTELLTLCNKIRKLRPRTVQPTTPHSSKEAPAPEVVDGTGNNDPGKEASLPFGTKVEGKTGFVHSPYAPEEGYVDVKDLPSGTKVKCPYTGKPFRVP